MTQDIIKDDLGHYILSILVQDIYNIFKDGPDGLEHYILLSILVQGKPYCKMHVNQPICECIAHPILTAIVGPRCNKDPLFWRVNAIAWVLERLMLHKHIEGSTQETPLPMGVSAREIKSNGL